MQIVVWILPRALQLLIVVGRNCGGLMSFIHAFQRLYLIRHEREINRRSRGAPASIPLQPSMHKSCLPPWPLTPPPLSDPTGGASSQRILPCQAFSQLYPPAAEQWAGVKGCLVLYSRASPPPTARDWLTTHLLHAACPLLYCVSIINNNLARLNGMTVVNTCQFKFVKGGLCAGGRPCVPGLGLLSDRSRFLKALYMLRTSRTPALGGNVTRGGVLESEKWFFSSG